MVWYAVTRAEVQAEVGLGSAGARWQR